MRGRERGAAPRRTPLALVLIVLAALAVTYGPRLFERGGATTLEPAPTSARETARPDESAASVDTRVGFTSERALDEHYEKHGREFGTVTRAQYLRLAQELRDAPAGGSVKEIVRDDGVITRFDTRSGAFIAFHRDGTIRTFFAPNEGLRYFERQAGKKH